MVSTTVETRAVTVATAAAAVTATAAAGTIIEKTVPTGAVTANDLYLLLRRVINKIPTLEDQENWTVWESDIDIYLTVIIAEKCITKKKNPDLSNKGTDLIDENTELDKR